MNASRRFRKSATVVERKIRGEHILVPIVGDMERLDSIYTLNSTGSLVWECAIQGMAEADVCQALVTTFDVDAQTTERDVTRLLDEFKAIGALEQVGE